VEDLKRDGPFRPEGDNGARVVKTVAEVAPRVAQLEAPLAAFRRGYSAIELTLQDGPPQTAIWLEVHIDP
jgi:hypothetical protein